MPKSKQQKQEEALARKENQTERWFTALRDAGWRFRDEPQNYWCANAVLNAYDRFVKHLAEVDTPSATAEGIANAACDGHINKSWLSHSVTLTAAQKVIDDHKQAALQHEIRQQAWLG